MTLFVEKGTFTKETSNVDGTDQVVSLTNGSLTPKVLWLWTDAQTANDSFSENFNWSYGYSDATTHSAVAFFSEDNPTQSDCETHFRSDSCVIINTTVGTPATVDARASCTAFAAGSFTLDWAVSSADACIIHYMVMGGTDITNVKVTQHTVGDTSTGAHAYTGIGFQGDFVQFLGPDLDLINGSSTSAGPYIGVATDSTHEWAFSGVSEDAAGNADTYSLMQSTDMCHIGPLPATGASDFEADFTTFGSDGFTFNVQDAVSNVNQRFSSLVIKGGLWDVGSGTAPAAAGQQTVNTTSGRDPEGVQIFTWGNTSTAAFSVAQNRVSIGGGDNSLTEGCISTHDADAGGLMVNTRISSVTKVIRAHTANATAGSSTTIAEADLVDMDNDGNFVIDWTTTLNGMGYVWFTVSQLSGEPPAVTDEERYMAVNTIPSFGITQEMDDLLQKITGIHPNIRTFPMIGDRYP
jgi:hypothetical protein